MKTVYLQIIIKHYFTTSTAALVEIKDGKVTKFTDLSSTETMYEWDGWNSLPEDSIGMEEEDFLYVIVHWFDGADFGDKTPYIRVQYI